MASTVALHESASDLLQAADELQRCESSRTDLAWVHEAALLSAGDPAVRMRVPIEEISPRGTIERLTCVLPQWEDRRGLSRWTKPRVNPMLAVPVSGPRLSASQIALWFRINWNKAPSSTNYDSVCRVRCKRKPMSFCAR